MGCGAVERRLEWLSQQKKKIGHTVAPCRGRMDHMHVPTSPIALPPYLFPRLRPLIFFSIPT